jgi:hypothetical protein
MISTPNNTMALLNSSTKAVKMCRGVVFPLLVWLSFEDTVLSIYGLAAKIAFCFTLKYIPSTSMRTQHILLAIGFNILYRLVTLNDVLLLYAVYSFPQFMFSPISKLQPAAPGSWQDYQPQVSMISLMLWTPGFNVVSDVMDPRF